MGATAGDDVNHCGLSCELGDGAGNSLPKAGPPDHAHGTWTRRA